MRSIRNGLQPRIVAVLRALLQRLDPASDDDGLAGPTASGSERSNVIMGTATYFAPTVHGGSAGGRVTIGNYSSIASGCEMVLEDPSLASAPATAEVERLMGHWPTEAGRASDITIGSDVWIGRGAKILRGATIGDGAVVAAYSVVTSDVRPYAVAAGNPAREMSRRFDDDLVESLLQIRWWEWSEDTVRARWRDLSSPDVRGFVQRYGSEATGVSQESGGAGVA